ncbi:hypothetical protein FB565_005917 [Actinoplanes lutulentus]|uniref:Uncharacterized protein n=1 Tax=Actinoplanes lutulentus TaxID=1287878 RepID=A0A327ZC08_9ACTN|nr:hypothetical protein [Actinoplanes lutulentus]RAK32849.1 hypothetical protein B0I29_113145 [Actinoplanes lutulentus]
MQSNSSEPGPQNPKKNHKPDNEPRPPPPTPHISTLRVNKEARAIRRTQEG